MARPKRQEERRSQLVAAAQRAIAMHGPDGARLNRVAEEAGLTSGAVLYYYPDIDELMFEANRAGMERFYEGRVRMLEGLADDPVPLNMAVKLQ
jgi:AcrR family transcriptional regulator